MTGQADALRLEIRGLHADLQEKQHALLHWRKGRQRVETGGSTDLEAEIRRLEAVVAQKRAQLDALGRCRGGAAPG